MSRRNGGQTIEYLANNAGYTDVGKCREIPECLSALEQAEAACGSPVFPSGSMKGFRVFLERHLDETDLRPVLGKHVVQKDGSFRPVKSLKDLGDYAYRVRSLVVHAAEIGGMYPWDKEVIHKPEERKWTTGRDVVPSEDFRRLLWRAIFRHFGLDIVEWWPNG